MSPKEISKKLRTFAHIEFTNPKYSSEKVIADKIKQRIDLFDRGHEYRIIDLDSSFPSYLLDNIEKFRNYLEI